MKYEDLIGCIGKLLEEGRRKAYFAVNGIILSECASNGDSMLR